VIGWAVALPVPIAILIAPSWAWIVAANALLGLNQGLTWSMAVVMKVDLVGPERRGLALGLNEAAGYGGVALGAAVAGLAATEFAARDVIAVSGIAVACAALLASVALVRDTAAHVALEQGHEASPPGLPQSLLRGTLGDRTLRACSQAGFVNNLNDGLVWGLGPLLLAAHGTGLGEIGLVAGLYPAVWGVGQIGAGWLSDHVGRKIPIVSGMLIQAGALGLLAATNGAFAGAVPAAVLLGAGTALVYPTLIAATSDRVPPVDRASAIGVYRFWRDAGYVAGAALAGLLAAVASLSATIGIVGALTAVSGLWVAAEMSEPAASGLTARARPRRAG
jgi:MFS family permease